MKIQVDGVEVDAARLLMELHNHTRDVGTGVFNDRPIGLKVAQDVIAALEADGLDFDFDYFLGKPIKCWAVDGVLGDSDRLLFDRDAGAGMFDRAVAAALKGESNG